MFAKGIESIIPFFMNYAIALCNNVAGAILSFITTGVENKSMTK